MKKHFMQYRNDCYTCCLATVLGLPYEEVPRFYNDNDELLGDWDKQVSAFLEKHNLQVVQVQMSPEVLKLLKGLAIVAGPSYTPEYRDRGEYHAVVYLNGELFHDPKPNPTGTIDPEIVDLLVPILRGAPC